MNFRLFAFATFYSCLIISCSTSKKTTKVSEPAINLDTIKVVANKTPEKKIYRGSNPLTNDIIHTNLWVSFDWQKSQMIGKAELHLKPYFYPTKMLYLNARGMEIKNVKLFEVWVSPKIVVEKIKKAETAFETREIPCTFIYENDSLKISLGREFTSKENYYVTIEYIAKPNDLKKGGSNAISSDKGLYFINPKGEDPNKMPQIWTQGETQSNSAWFPTVDSPNEKMTDDIYMTVNNKYTTLSNGLLTESKYIDEGTRMDHWHMDLPHSAYLLMMGVGEFVKITDSPWNGKEISYYVEKEFAPYAKDIFGNTKEMIEFYSNKLGVPYAWPKYAQIVVRDYVSGAMENTSATLHGDFMIYQTPREMIDGKKGDGVICHELFHQWFGDLVTAESWSNLPLNESFATYGEYLWEEYKNGRDAADEHHASSRSGYMMQSGEKEVNLIRFEYDHREDMFDGFSYNKGGQVLHMLRKYVGDDAFFASLKLYLETRKFKSAEIHDLRLAFEETTGEDMNWFFNEWFLNKGHPNLEINKSYNETDKILKLNIKQTQDFTEAPLYKLPVYIDIYAGGKKERQRIWIDEASQTFTFNVSSKPELVNFDGERQLLATVRYEKTKEEYIFQYKNAGLWNDRDEALEYFKKHLGEKVLYELVKQIAQNDKWRNMRTDAIYVLSEEAKGSEDDLKILFMTIANNDANSKVRASAIEALAAHFKGADLDALYEKALNEQSYAIIGEALAAVAKTNTVIAMQKAKGLENDGGKKILLAIADIYASNGTDENLEFFNKAKSKFSGFELLGYGSLYGKFLKRCTKPETALAGADELSKMAKSDNKFVKYTALKIFKNSLIDEWEERENKLKSNLEAKQKANADIASLISEIKIAGNTKTKLQEIYNTVK